MSIENPRVAIIGLGFGAEFIPIYQRHPNAEIVAICQRNEESLNKIADEYGVAKRFTDYEQLLQDPDIDAVHIPEAYQYETCRYYCVSEYKLRLNH